MKLFIVSIVSLLMINVAYAQPTPYKYPTAANSIPPPTLGVGPWVDMTNIEADPDYSTSGPTVITGSLTDRLYSWGYSFGVPAGSTITGVEVEIIRRQTGSAIGSLRDYEVTLMTGVAGGTVIGDNKAVPAVSWENFDQTVVYGGPTDTWGVALNPSIVNASGFGAGIVAERFQLTGFASIRAQVRSFRMRIFYSAPLPIVLKSFDVRKVGSSANISWVTTEEVNVKGYEIQRSANGTDFKTIATVTPASPNSQLETAYQVTDDAPLPGRNFYRLKQNDLDGQYEIFPMKMVNFDDGQSYFKIQAVSGSTLRIKYANKPGRYNLLVRDAMGRLLQTETLVLDNRSAELNVSLKSGIRGIVFVTIDGQGAIFSNRFLIQ